MVPCRVMRALFWRSFSAVDIREGVDIVEN